MVNNLLKKILPVLLFTGVFFLSGCTVDLLGLFGSTDLDKRLEERNSFKFLTESERSLSSLGDEYSFIVVADTHIEDGKTWDFEKLKDVIESNSDIKFVVVAGDVTQYGTAQDIQKFIDIARSFPVPCYPVIGNHDVYFGNWPEWKRLIGSTCYRINGDGTTLFMMDSANGFFGKDQLDWLEKELKSTSGRVFVFTHANLFVETLLEIQQFTDTKERARIVSILRNKCDIMFMGHSHKRTFNEAGNVRYISVEDFIVAQVYCLVTVTKTGVSYKFEKL